MEKLMHEVVAEKLCHEYGSNSLHEGRKLPGERELAEYFNCSRSTIRSALDSLQSQGVLARFPGKGTFLTGILKDGPKRKSVGQAKSVASAKTGRKQLGFLCINSFMTTYCMLESLRYQLKTDEWKIDFWSVDTDTGSVEDIYEEISRSCDAVLITGNFTTNDLAPFCRFKNPVVIIGTCADKMLQHFNCPYIQLYWDYRNSYRRAVNYIWSKGYRKPAIFLRTPHLGYKERYEGFCEGVMDHGNSPEDFIAFYGDSHGDHYLAEYDDVRGGIEKLFRERDRFDCIITTCYPSIIGGAIKRGLSIPDDLGLVAETSFQDRFMMEFNITEMRPNEETLVQAIAFYLKELVQGNITQSSLSIPTQMIYRNSC